MTDPTPDLNNLSDDGDRLSALREEQIARWTSGDRVPAETLLAANPDLTFEDAQVLIVGEMLLRFDAGEVPTADEYAARFPDHADDLRAQFDLQGTLDGPLLPSFGPVEPASVPGYLITGELGKGGWATVYLARHLVLGRPVALKVFNPVPTDEEHFARRFIEEARILAKLDHPNIIRVYDSGTAGDRLYMALEYAPNGTLADRVKAGGTLPIPDAVAVVTKLARAVGVAHMVGIVHRDIKPSNVLLGKTGEPLLADFGLAKDVADSLALTALGTTVGTPAYMAPEQARAEPGTLGPPADVYALAAVLYELISGTPPLVANTTAHTLRMIQEDIPKPLTEREPKTPKWLSDLVAKCLDKSRDKRPQSGNELADRLTAGEVPAAPEAPAKKSWWKWW